MPYPTLRYPNLSYPTSTTLPPHSHPTPSKHVLNSLSKHIAYLTLPNPALPCTAVPWPTPPLSTLRPARPTWRHFRSFGTPRPFPWIKLILGIGRGVPDALSVFVCAHFNPFRSENKSIEWTIVTNRMDSVNSVDSPYMDMSEFSKLYTCQVYKYWNVELQNVNISKYPWPLDGIIIYIP